MHLYDIFSEIARLSLMGSVLVGMILLIKAFFKDKFSAKWHYYIWMLLFLRLVIPYAPQHQLSVFNLFNPIVEQLNVDTPLPGALPLAGEVETKPGMVLNPALPEPQKPISSIPQPKTVGEKGNSKDFIGLIWLSGSLLVGGVIVLSNRRFMLRAGKKPLLTDTETLNILSQCQRMLGIKKNVPILLEHKISSPLLFGVLKPKLLANEETLKRLSNEEKRYVFLHELMHLKRKDILVNWIMAALKCIYWFNPVIWYAGYRMKEDCEVACDESVLRLLNPPEYKSYGETILNMVKRLSVPLNRTCTTGVAGRKSSIKRRIHMIAGFRKKTLVWTVLAIALTFLVGCTSMTGAKLGSQKVASNGANTEINQQDSQKEGNQKAAEPENASEEGENVEGNNNNPADETNSDEQAASTEPSDTTTKKQLNNTEMTIEEKIQFNLDKLKDQTYTGTYGDGYIWYTAAEELGMIGKPAIPYLIEKLETKDDYERALALYALLLASQQENVKSFTGGEYIDVTLDFNAENHPDMVKKAMDWWNKYKSNF